MSEVYDRASLSMSLADYAVTDQLGKLHIIGGGLQVLPRDHASGLTAAFALVVSMTFAPDLFSLRYAFEVELEEANGAPVRLAQVPPGAAGGPGTKKGNVQISFDSPSMRARQSSGRPAGSGRPVLK
jgi:hypothetical protein